MPVIAVAFKRDLVAASSVFNFAIAQGGCDANPTLVAMKATKEKRYPIVLPAREHVELVPVPPLDRPFHLDDLRHLYAVRWL